MNYIVNPGDFQISCPIETSWIKYLDPEDLLSPFNRRALENLGYGFLIFRDTWPCPTGPNNFDYDTIGWALHRASTLTVWPTADLPLPCDREAVAWEVRKLACGDFSTFATIVLTSTKHHADWLSLARQLRRKGVPILHPRVTTEIDQ